MQATAVPSSVPRLLAAFAVALLASACGGGGSSSDPTPSPCSTGPCVAPPAPTAVTALPKNGAATLSWAASAGATSYRVYHAASPAVSASSDAVTTQTPGATVAALSNGAARYFAVSAVNATGESALSPVACAVPTAADTAGLRLHDALCGEVLDAARWASQSGFGGARVSGGAAELSARAANQESRLVRATTYTTTRSAVTGGRRVTTFTATVSVPAATASRVGSAELQAAIRLVYQPPALRAAGNQDYLDLTVGLIEKNAGLQVFRGASHCDAAVCTTAPATGIAFADPAGLTSINAAQAGAPAAYDTPYTLTASLDEATGVFHWTIAGGAYGAGISGAADPSAYLAASAGWSGVSLATGFLGAQLMARTQDKSAAGGGSGAITAVFDDVQVGLDGGAATPFDDFGGTGDNSGPGGLSPARWSPQGSRLMLVDQGSLLGESFVESVGTAAGTSSYHGLVLANPGGVDTLQAEVWVPSFAATTGSSEIAYLQGRYYRTGTSDVSAQLMLNAATGAATFSIGRCLDAACSTQAAAGSGTLGTFAPATRHVLRIGWNPTARTLAFRVDGATTTVDPQVAGAVMTQALPYGGAAASPQRAIMTGVSLPAGIAAGTRAGLDVRVNNVFVSP